MAMTLVSTVTVGSGGAASIEFTGIAGTGKDLLCLISARNASTGVGLQVTFNSDTGNNYTGLYLQGTGSAADSSSITTNYLAYVLSNPSGATASTFGNASIYVSNYTSSTSKSISSDSVGENNATAARQRLLAGSYSTSSPITSFKIAGDGSNLVEHTTASLYIIS